MIVKCFQPEQTVFPGSSLVSLAIFWWILILKKLNLFINLVYLSWRNKETQRLLLVCVRAVLCVAWRKDGVVWLEALFCFEERRRCKDYLLLLGYSPCSSPLRGISCDVREGKKWWGFFWENNSHSEFKMGFLRAPSLKHGRPKIHFIVLFFSDAVHLYKDGRCLFRVPSFAHVQPPFPLSISCQHSMNPRIMGQKIVLCDCWNWYTPVLSALNKQLWHL